MELTERERRWLDGPLSGLTPREREVALAVCEGGDHEHVAASLCIAVPTLRTHLMRIHQKLGAESKVDVVRFVSARLLELYRERGATPDAGGFSDGASEAGGDEPSRAAPKLVVKRNLRAATPA